MMNQLNKRLTVVMMAAGLAMPAMCRAEDKVPTPSDSKTGVPGSNTNTVGSENNLNKGPTGSTGAVNTQDSKDGVKVDQMDHQFILDAANGGMAEVEAGKLAQEKGQSQQVKDFGAKMVKDHTMANEKLKAVAASKGITLASDVTGMEKEHLDKLAKYNGAEFDKMYTEHMIKDHAKDIADFKKEAMKGTDADVKAFASNTLPTLKEHQKMITMVAEKSGDADLAKLASEKQTPDDSK